MEKVRIDKWLWSVRIFKSRTIATDACKEGKVKLNGISAKSSQLIQVGDQVEVKKEGFNMQYKVLNLIEKRVGAPIAQACYEDLTPAEELNKYKDWFVGKAGAEYREKGAGRPTKKERRVIDDFKDHR
ncbi:MAG: RNA-binding S4 domain-containing protein [Saprospiraceae bacterium]|jgi:ribosome-associated heat shock protein Hsp15|nr:RNA-binding S4 domain-containing protein [Saprospiraceae bacterium]HRD81533.1 RNA-binding S4 domain-containing protein [Saprospiraceae bacterium]HRF41801.1 RNA-binding S4 domain-containing protein [Saprospiraceae bacterium]HRJ17036.1 RNA-binding S4 domain-containing protein [Saprospiraceae bacterium]HRK81289.1 RNA-binding S4 domain-containing protein [Saprospiraceae bacterium]